MDRLKAMHSFVRVMHAGNFSTAARQLGVSRALVSRHIIDLEHHLGFSLLSRSTRSVVPTDDAYSYLKLCERVFRELEGEQQFVRDRGKNAGTLKVVAPKSFGTLNLSDAILDFAQAEPNFRISLSLEDFSFRPYDFIEKGYDIAICISSISDSALISRRIAALDWVLCATPEYVQRHGKPSRPAEVKHHPCLVHLNLEFNDRIWRFEGDASRSSIKIDGPFRSNSVIVLRKAALRSLGLAILPRYAIAADLSSGALIPLLQRHRLAPRPLSAVYPRPFARLPKIRTFVAWLARWFREHDPNRQVGA
jgi:DNA-binding transcriptional LysR family regulator